MDYSKLLVRGLCRGAFLTSVSIVLSLGASEALGQESPPRETVRQEVAKPLQTVQDLVNAKNYQEALAKIREAEAVPDKTPYELFLIDQMRGPVAAAAGDRALAIKSFEAIIDSGRLPPAKTLPMIEAIVGMYYQDKDYKGAATWAERFRNEGGINQKITLLRMQSLYFSGDYANAAREISADIHETEKSGKIPTEELLLLLANSSQKLGNQEAYVAILEKLVTYHPKNEYWAHLIYRVESKPTFVSRLTLNLYRLKFALGLISKASDYMTMALLAMQAGFPIEAKQVIEQGFAKGVLGTGADLAAQTKLRDLAIRDAEQDRKLMAQSEADALSAREGTGLVNVGFNYVIDGQGGKGVALMESGLRKGGLKRPEEAMLRLGMAYALTGQKQKATDTLKAVQGADGTGDLARLWGLFALRPTR